MDTTIITGIVFTLILLATVFFIIIYVHKKFQPKIIISETKPFDFLGQCDPADVLEVLQREQPLIIALVLAHIEPPKAAILLQKLPAALQGEVTRLIAVMDRTSMEIIRGIERVLAAKLSGSYCVAYSLGGGVENAAELLKLVDAASEKRIISVLDNKDPELAEAIKNRLFVFDDIVRLDDRAVQKIFREVDSLELAKALRAASKETQNKIFNNMSKRASVMLKEDMEYMGPVRASDAEEAQQKIINVIRQLEESGEIIVSRREEEKFV
ncbi:MAG: flagellar motor switch protein FliG [Spirochaetaceae bacterium]|nr:flagellar motor switch protein FliG [Spirochaetaceae bacterium]